MFISCDCSVDDGEGAEVWSVIWRKARKRHSCCECHRRIRPREKYELCSGKWDGEWSNFKTCLGCVRIREHLAPNGHYYGHLAEAVKECIGFNYVTMTQLPLELDARNYGMEQAAMRNPEWLELFRSIALDIWRPGKQVSIEDVREEAEARGFEIVPGNWMGSVFKREDDGWRAVGYRLAKHEGSHGRPVRVWVR